MTEHTFDREDLLRTLKIASCGLAVKKSVVPVFDMFCIQDDYVIAYNDVIGVRASLEDSSGLKALLPGDVLMRLLSGYSASVVKMRVEEEAVKIRCGRSSATLNGMSMAAWPWYGPPKDGKEQVTIPLSEGFLSGLNAAMISMTYSDSVPSYTGVTLEQTGSSVCLYTTNRKAITRFDCSSYAQGVTMAAPITLPPMFCEHLVGIWNQVKDEADDCVIRIYSDHVVAEFGGAEDITLFSKLLYVEKPSLFSEKLDGMVGPTPIEAREVTDEFRSIVDRLCSLQCDIMEFNSDANGAVITSTGSSGLAEVKELFTWPAFASMKQQMRLDASLTKTALSKASHMDLRLDGDTFVVFTNGGEFTHFVACGRG